MHAQMSWDGPITGLHQNDLQTVTGLEERIPGDEDVNWRYSGLQLQT